MTVRGGVFVATLAMVVATVAVGTIYIQWLLDLATSFWGNQLQVLHTSRIDCSSRALHLYVKNRGGVPAAIQAIEVVGFERISVSPRFSIGEPRLSPVIVNPNTVHVLSVPLSKNYVCGATYQVRVYTTAGSAYAAVIYAE